MCTAFKLATLVLVLGIALYKLYGTDEGGSVD